jgi:hypothetical protein
MLQAGRNSSLLGSPLLDPGYTVNSPMLGSPLLDPGYTVNSPLLGSPLVPGHIGRTPCHTRDKLIPYTPAGQSNFFFSKITVYGKVLSDY